MHRDGLPQSPPHLERAWPLKLLFKSESMHEQGLISLLRDHFYFFAELMVMGFISLLLTVFQKSITSLCMPESFSHYLLPCPYVAPVKTEVPPAATHARKLLSWGVHSLVEKQKGSPPCRRSLLAWGVRRLQETQTGATPAGVVEGVTCPAVSSAHWDFEYSGFEYLRVQNSGTHC